MVYYAALALLNQVRRRKLMLKKVNAKQKAEASVKVQSGSVAEWLKAPVLKTGEGLRPP